MFLFCSANSVIGLIPFICLTTSLLIVVSLFESIDTFDLISVEMIGLDACDTFSRIYSVSTSVCASIGTLKI